MLYWSAISCDLSPIEQATRIHHRLVWIHPFPNGNGRFARLIADMYLKSLGCTHPTWPVDLQNDSPDRKRYINTLKAADKGDFGPLIAFTR